MIPLTETAAGVSFAVRVQPRARISAVTGVHDNALKIGLSSPPLEGRANAALIELLADFLHVSRSRISILTGDAPRPNGVTRTGSTASEGLVQVPPCAL